MHSIGSRRFTIVQGRIGFDIINILILLAYCRHKAVSKVTATSGFVGYMGTNGETNIRGPQEFNWDATSGQSLRIGAAGGNYRYYTEAQIKVQRIS